MLWTVTLRGNGHRSRDAPLRPSVAKPCHVKREARGGYGERGVVPLFPYSLRPSRQSRELKKERNKGSGTPADADQHPPHLAMRRAPCKARSPFGVPPRLLPKGVSHPKGSASGQASWDLV